MTILRVDTTTPSSGTGHGDGGSGIPPVGVSLMQTQKVR